MDKVRKTCCKLTSNFFKCRLVQEATQVIFLFRVEKRKQKQGNDKPKLSFPTNLRNSEKPLGNYILFFFFFLLTFL